jgi:hypothetical protein
MSRDTWFGQDNEWPRNADRARWAAFAVAKFANATGMSEDLTADPETVLADLLADLMHWCDAQRTSRHLIKETVDFESALGRARDHYREEFANDGAGRLEDPHTP